MINPADARAYYFYTPDEVATAREILGANHRYKSHTVAIDPATGRAYLDQPLYPQTWVKWASKVLTWYGRFTQVLRRYAAQLHSVALAQVAAWQNLKAGISVPRMLRTDTAPVQEESRSSRAQVEGRHAPAARWIDNPRTPRADAARHGYAVTATNPKTQKHTRRAQVLRTTDRLQSAAAW